MSARNLHANGAVSGGLAAAIAMGVAQVIFLAIGLGPLGALEYGLSLAAIAFGGTYAGVFFVGRARRGRVAAGSAVPQS
ncbi:MAG: hypothetical protein ACR2LI_12065 [Propionibacteriaceae bacterium]